MKCPYCGAEMTDVYMNTQSVMFSENKHKLMLYNNAGEKYAKKMKYLTFMNEPCQLCVSCKKVIIDISGFKDNIFEE